MDIQRGGSAGGSRTLTIYATYEEMVDALGYPEDLSGKTAKIDVQWDVEYVDTGRSLSAWNYKNGPNYRGEEGTPVTEIKSWSADGSKELAEDLGLEVEGMY